MSSRGKGSIGTGLTQSGNARNKQLLVMRIESAANHLRMAARRDLESIRMFEGLAGF